MDANLDAPKILLVETDRQLATSIGLLCVKANWKIDQSYDADSALELLRLNEYKVILVDYELPSMNGLEFTKRLHKFKPNQMVIMLASNVDTEMAVSSKNSGVRDLLQKPLDYDSFVRLLTQAFNETKGIKRTAPIEFKLSQNYTFDSAQLSGLNVRTAFADELMASGKLDATAKLKLELAFQEALANALDHGNLELKSEWKEKIDNEGIDLYSKLKRERLNDPVFSKRKISVSIELRQGVLALRIKDQGQGFEYPKGNVMSSRTDSLACHGRGLTIILASMDEVKFAAGGSEITMLKYLS